jgi:hypothetical protein
LTFTIFRGSILDTNYYKKETRAMTIGERLRFLRLRNNLTQEELRRKYADRITSRLFGEFRPLAFAGTDIRAQKLKG